MLKDLQVNVLQCHAGLVMFRNPQTFQSLRVQKNHVLESAAAGAMLDIGSHIPTLCVTLCFGGIRSKQVF